jgi:uncharacterized repeat protein (TIGR01451 family)
MSIARVLRASGRVVRPVRPWPKLVRIACFSLLVFASGVAVALPDDGIAAVPKSDKGPNYTPSPTAALGYELIEYVEASSVSPKAAPPASSSGSSLFASPKAGFDGPSEVEPNNTSATATPIGDSAQINGAIYPPAPPAATTDIDFFSFNANAGDRIYAAVQTLFDASASGDTVLELIAPDGTTVIETDPNDGTFNASSSSIAGTPIAANGTHFLRLRHNVATGSVRPYSLHFRRQTSAPVAEVEPNNSTVAATPMPASGYVSGTVTAVSPGETDFYSINLNAGDTVFLSLDMNPERDAAVWNGRLGLGQFGNPPANQILIANDANAGAAPADPNSEAFFFTVKDAGTYFIYVDAIVAAGLGANATYNLSASVQPAFVHPGSCTTYTSTDVPVAIPTGPGLVQSTITVPGNPRIDDLNVQINLNHTFMQDLDVHLVSPAGNDNGLFTDVGAATTGGPQTLMDIVLDDEAGLPFGFALTAPFHAQPELAYRLSWFDGEDAGGTWTLVLRDDATGDGGTLNSWSLRICEPPPPPTCGPGQIEEVVYSTDFETDDGGFTHSGAQDEWERGLPTAIPITTCNSGVNCFKTDLDDGYNASSNQNLLSPNIDLSGYVAPVTVRWAQRYHIESANFDHAWVDAQEVGGANPVRLFEWRDATMNNTVGNPAVTIAESSGWSIIERQVNSLAGLNAELNFHLDSDTTVQLRGLAIDDVQVRACRVLSSDLAITKTDGVASATPGGSVTYTITASNAGPDPVVGATVADTFPAVLTCSSTCDDAGGGTCAAGPISGNINDTVDLPAGTSVTYTSTCTINPSATGSLVNTATVSSTNPDPDPANNSATDTDTLTPQADVAITKTDGVATAIPGGSVTYTITASNAGPSDAPGSSVADTFPASLTCNWTCVGAGGGTCTAGPVGGNIADTVNLPAGGSVTYTASCAISAAATGSLANTATATASVTDPNPGNNSATDTDTLTPQADLAITKTNGTATSIPGGTTTYTIVASNSGLSNAGAATVADTFPAALTCNWTCVGAGGGTCTAGPVAGNISDAANLPAGGSATYTAICSIDANATGSLSNTATVSSAVTDPNPANNSATDVDTLTPQADLSITKTDGVSAVTPGSSTIYTITASNAGQSNATGATVADTFPAACNAPTWTCVGAGGGTCTAAGSGAINDTVNLPAGGSVTYSATCPVDIGASGTLSNTASVAAPAGVTDPNPGNNSATDVDSISILQADLQTNLSDSPDPIVAGNNLTYVASFTNAGPDVADAAQVSLPLPAGTTFVSVSTSLGGSCISPAVGANGTVTCSWAGLTASGVTRTATIVALVDAATTGTLNATATASSNSVDPVPANDAAIASTTVTAAPADLALVLTSAPASVDIGDSVTLTGTATNNGPGPAQNVVITIVLPAGLRFDSVAPSAGGVCVTPAVGSSGSVVCTFAGATPVGGIHTVVVTAIARGAGNALVTGSATATSTDPTPANAQASTTVAVASNAIPQPAVVPALDRMMLLWLVLLLGVFGLVAVRRQS